MKNIKVSKPDKSIVGKVTLSGSKSISNRVLIIRALCEDTFHITNLSDSDDTKTLKALLKSEAYELDAHHAGTTFRFLTSLLAIRAGENLLTGSDRMQERPIRALVEAWNEMGATIAYTKNDGYPPLKIGNPGTTIKSEIKLSADISSQYISSLLLVAPSLPDGLKIQLVGEIVSRPYLEMTLKIMEYFGVSHHWEDQTISVAPQRYIARDYYVEADWSAASYYYIMAAMADDVDLYLSGLREESLQGDAAIVEIGNAFGLRTEFRKDQIRITKNGKSASRQFEYDFLQCPDIAQSVSTMCAGVNSMGLFSGLQTLRIKETDRIAALQNELGKVGVFLSQLPEKFSKKSKKQYYMLDGTLNTGETIPQFATYNDHRMAMAFAPLAMLFPIVIKDYKVVSKSYPNFWEDLKSLGFLVESV